ncbi:MAG TPA: carboxylesterase family protein [Acidobacteriaceae bacterium]|nr:carboxylesterase family protein [Acidobacteriaceae bacterium]
MRAAAVALLAGILTATAALAQSPTAATASPQVRTRQGMLQGQSEWTGAAVFQGIPYAAPPVGDLRWKPPQPPASWDGVRDATKAPHSCMQVNWGWNARDAQDESEDCLYLNIATPSLHPQHPLPVFFWIHGGANYNGSGRYAHGQTLTAHGVILVSINYRLGVFGFLALPALSAESPHRASGNYALLDQMAALAWVRDNIAQFGGDPGNITMAGQSAGAMDVGMLLAAPQSRDLFAKAIAESGGPITPVPVLPTRSEEESIGESFAAFAGAPSGPAQLSALRAMSAADLLEAAHRYTAPDREGVPTHEGPALSVDGWVLPLQPAAAIRDGASHNVPLLIGNNIQEFSFSRSSVIQANAPPDPPDALRHAIEHSFGEQAPAAIEAYGLAHSDAPPVDPQLGSAGTQMMTDTLFRCPARIAGDWLSHRGLSVWEYQFERPLPGSGSASTRHSGELPYVFGWAQRAGSGVMGATYTPVDAALSQQMQGYWTNFAKTGNPNGSGLPAWPAFAGAAPPLMHFTAAGTSLAAPLQARKACLLYQKHVEQQLAPGQ